MGSSEDDKVVAVIMVGGPTKGKCNLFICSVSFTTNYGMLFFALIDD